MKGRLLRERKLTVWPNSIPFKFWGLSLIQYFAVFELIYFICEMHWSLWGVACQGIEKFHIVQIQRQQIPLKMCSNLPSPVSKWILRMTLFSWKSEVEVLVNHDGNPKFHLPFMTKKEVPKMLLALTIFSAFEKFYVFLSLVKDPLIILP